MSDVENIVWQAVSFNGLAFLRGDGAWEAPAARCDCSYCGRRGERGAQCEGCGAKVEAARRWAWRRVCHCGRPHEVNQFNVHVCADGMEMRCERVLEAPGMSARS